MGGDWTGEVEEEEGEKEGGCAGFHCGIDGIVMEREAVVMVVVVVVVR